MYRSDTQRLQIAARQILETTTELVDTIPQAAYDDLIGDDTLALAGLTATLQEARRLLATLEAQAAMVAGRHLADQDPALRDGNLPDGRQFTWRRTADRKAWRHDDWQADARRNVLATLNIGADLVDPATGVEVNAHDLMRAIETVHGAGAPRTGVMKALGMDPGDYCETTRGAWKLDTIAPTTTTEETTTDA